MKIENAIQDVYGVKIHNTPSDLALRKFKIDQLRNGFLMKSENSGLFGSIIDAETYIWTPEGLIFFRCKHKENKDIRFEWLIWEAARSMLEKGEGFNKEDSDRLLLAVRRLEEWL